MRIIPTKETLTVEFKSDRKGGYPDRELVENVVSMANTEGGDLYLGVEDHGEITGIAKKHEDEIGISAMIMNSIVPSLFIHAEIIWEEGKPVMKITVPKSRSVVATMQGKILRRRLKSNGQPENVPMYPYEITTRLSDLSLLDFSAQSISGATVDDFNANEILRLRSMIKKSNGDETLLDLDDEELEKALCFVKDVNGTLTPTVTGLLVIGKEEKIEEYIPTATSVFQVLEGTRIRKNEQYRKPVLAALEIFETNFDAWNSEQEIEEGLLRMRAPEFSKRAYREALINSYSHRDYTMLGSVRVVIDDDGLTISNPGGFIEGISIDNLLTAEPHGRNKTLTDALKRIGLAEKTGRGIDRIYEGSILFGRPWPDYTESNSRMVKLFIQRANPDFSFAKMIADEQIRTGKSMPIISLMILSCILQERRVHLKRILERTHSSEARVEYALNRLLEAGLIEVSGSGTCRSYILNEKIYHSPNGQGYERDSNINEKGHEELILDFIQKHPEGVKRKEVCDYLAISKDQAYRLLKKLVRNHEIEVIGKGVSTRYQAGKSYK